MAYIAYGLGGLVAVDVTGGTPTYAGYVPAVPAHGPDEPTGSLVAEHPVAPWLGNARGGRRGGRARGRRRGRRRRLQGLFQRALRRPGGGRAAPRTRAAHWHGPHGKGAYNNDTKPERLLARLRVRHLLRHDSGPGGRRVDAEIPDRHRRQLRSPGAAVDRRDQRPRRGAFRHAQRRLRRGRPGRPGAVLGRRRRQLRRHRGHRHARRGGGLALRGAGAPGQHRRGRGGAAGTADRGGDRAYPGRDGDGQPSVPRRRPARHERLAHRRRGRRADRQPARRGQHADGRVSGGPSTCRPRTPRPSCSAKTRPRPTS